MKVTYIILLLLLLSFLGCEDITEQAKYQRPSWLAGKLYTQIAAEEDLSLFAQCLELTGYDTILDISGSFSVFAPHNEAFGLFFQDHPEYGGQVENIPLAKLDQIVRIHIIQNSWSKLQLQSLDIYGWIDEDDPENDKPRGYKRQTLLRDENQKYWVYSKKGNTTIVDSTESNSYRMVYTPSRKYAPLFFDEYFPINKLATSDYDFYYGRSYEPGNIFYSEGKVLGDEVFAENGFIYKIDRVISPLLNAEQLLKETYAGRSYRSFLEMIHQFPEFSSNLEETYKQPEAKEGKQYDTLYNLNYTDIAFNIHEELTGPNTKVSDYTVRYQNGVLAPSDEAFQTFIDEVLTASSGFPRWGSYEKVPNEIKRIIANTHLTSYPVYYTNIMEGIENAAGDVVRLDPGDISHKIYGSNCTFLGLDITIIPRAFSSVAGPVYLRPGYSTLLYAMEYTKILPALKREEATYAFYILPDLSLQADSSLEIEWVDREANLYKFRAFNSSA